MVQEQQQRAFAAASRCCGVRGVEQGIEFGPFEVADREEHGLLQRDGADPSAPFDMLRAACGNVAGKGADGCRLGKRAVPASTGRSRRERSVVWAMLRNPACKGRACFGKTRSAPRQFVRPLRASDGFAGRNSVGRERPREGWIGIPVPATVSEETLALAEKQLQQNKTFSKRRTGTPSISQGLVACRKCDYALYRASARTSAARTSAGRISCGRCPGSDSWCRLNGPLCDSRPARRDLLNDIVRTGLVRLLEDPAPVQAGIDRRVDAARVSDPDQQREADLRHRLVKVRNGIDRLATACREEQITIDELRDGTPELRRPEQAPRRELESAVDRARDRETCLRLAEALTGFPARLRFSAETPDIAERQRIVRLLVKETPVTEDKIIIRHSIPITGSSGGGPDPSKPGGGGPERRKLPFAFGPSQVRYCRTSACAASCRPARPPTNTRPGICDGGSVGSTKPRAGSACASRTSGCGLYTA